MSSLKIVLISCCILLFFSCKQNKSNAIKDSNNSTDTVSTVTLSKSQKILNKTIAAHGGDLYNTAHYSFIFRGNTYSFKNTVNGYEYWKETKTDSNLIQDYLKNDKFSRTTFNESNKGEWVDLSEKEIKSAKGAINSVIYFATLPHKLNDKAVNSKYVESTSIKNKNYDVIEITFNKEGGGEDHDDEFYYWINKDTNKIDYLAYNYTVNKGGVRFRNAYNRSVVDGITFQDYINYKAETGTPLKDLPTLYEAEELKELSKIKTENIINLNKN